MRPDFDKLKPFAPWYALLWYEFFLIYALLSKLIFASSLITAYTFKSLFVLFVLWYILISLLITLFLRPSNTTIVLNV